MDNLSVQFVDAETTVHVFEGDKSRIADKLKTGIYTIEYEQFKGFFLKKSTNDFIIPEKIFGDVERRVDMIMKRYEISPQGLGVICSGDKGSGKTLLSGFLVNQFLANEKPVILVNQPFENAVGMLGLISKISDCLVIFDEFEKNYDVETQELFLGYFDDKSQKHRLNVVIANDYFRLNEFLLSRPSRFFYHFQYEKLSNDTICEVMKFYGFDDDIIKQVYFIKEKSAVFSYDILNAILSELKLTGSTDVKETIEHMNILVGYCDMRNEKIEVVGFEQLTSQDQSTVHFKSITRDHANNFHVLIDVKKRHETEFKSVGVTINEDELNGIDGDVQQYIVTHRGVQCLLNIRITQSTPALTFGKFFKR